MFTAAKKTITVRKVVTTPHSTFREICRGIFKVVNQKPQINL